MSKYLISVLMFVLLLTSVQAGEPTKLFIYTNELAQGFSRQPYSLLKGEQQLSSVDLPGSTLPGSVRYSFPEGVRLLKTVTPKKQDAKTSWLRKLVGQKIYLLNNGIAREVRLIAADDTVVVDDEGRVLLDPEGTFGVPPELYKKITATGSPSTYEMQLQVESSRALTGEMPYSFLAGQMSWKVIYHLSFDERNNTLDLQSFLNIANYSGSDFKPCQLTLVAGALNVESAQPGPVVFAKAALNSPVSPTEPQPMGDYYRITVPGLQILPNNEEIQLPWLNRTGIKVEKNYQLNFTGGYGGDQKTNAQIYLTLNNTKKSNLALRLPAGDAFVYNQPEPSTLLAKISLPDITLEKQVDLLLGNAFDCFGEKRDLKHERLDGNDYLNNYEIKVTNSSAMARSIEVVDRYYGVWQVASASEPYTIKDANTLTFRLALTPGQTKTVTYQIRTK